MVAQFFEPTQTAKNLRGRELLCPQLGFFSRGREIAPVYPRARAQHVGPPQKKRFEQTRATLQIETFIKRLVIILALIEPRTIRRILVTRLITLVRGGVLVLNFLANSPEQALQSSRK